MPTLPVSFFAWCALGGVSQIAGTALLLRTMRERNFAVGVAYSRTEVVQVAFFSLDPSRRSSQPALCACGRERDRRRASACAGGSATALRVVGGRAVNSRSALLGIACGAGVCDGHRRVSRGDAGSRAARPG